MDQHVSGDLDELRSRVSELEDKIRELQAIVNDLEAQQFPKRSKIVDFAAVQY